MAKKNTTPCKTNKRKKRTQNTIGRIWWIELVFCIHCVAVCVCGSRGSRCLRVFGWRLPTFQLQTYAQWKLKHNATSGTINKNQLSESKSKRKPSSVGKTEITADAHCFPTIVTVQFFSASPTLSRSLGHYNYSREAEKTHLHVITFIHIQRKQWKKASVLCTPVIKSNLLYYSFVLASEFRAKTEN